MSTIRYEAKSRGERSCGQSGEKQDRGSFVGEITEQTYSDDPLPVHGMDLSEIQEDPIVLPVSAEKHALFKGVLRNILPYLGSDEGKIILTEVLVALKLEGIIGKELNQRETKMVNVIKDSILQEPKKKTPSLTPSANLIGV